MDSMGILAALGIKNGALGNKKQKTKNKKQRAGFHTVVTQFFYMLCIYHTQRGYDLSP
jgi:hypothetical protein